MKTVLIAPDKFKGSLTASQVCDAVREGIKKFDPNIECVVHPLADGGEGTLEALEDTLDFDHIELEVNDPLFRPITASYRLSGGTAFVEMSKASGLQLLPPEERNCMHTTTYGTGELLADALKHGAKRVYLFVGGSATNDAGLGLAAALGYRFLDPAGDEIKPIGGEMERLAAIDDSQISFDMSSLEVFVVCDVKSPFYGSNGAAYVYGAQKGASPEEIESLDRGLINVSDVIGKKYGIDLSHLEGAGAAGGIAGGAVAFLGATLRSGIHSVMDITKFEEKIGGVDLIITGEGKLDEQTINGKVVDGVYEVAKRSNKPIAIVCGIAEDIDLIGKKIKAPVYQVKTVEIPIEKAINDAYDLLVERSFQLAKDHFNGA